MRLTLYGPKFCLFASSVPGSHRQPHTRRHFVAATHLRWLSSVASQQPNAHFSRRTTISRSLRTHQEQDTPYLTRAQGLRFWNGNVGLLRYPNPPLAIIYRATSSQTLARQSPLRASLRSVKGLTHRKPSLTHFRHLRYPPLARPEQPHPPPATRRVSRVAPIAHVRPTPTRKIERDRRRQGQHPPTAAADTEAPPRHRHHIARHHASTAARAAASRRSPSPFVAYRCLFRASAEKTRSSPSARSMTTIAPTALSRLSSPARAMKEVR